MYHYITPMKDKKQKLFQAYPGRKLTISDEVWERLKKDKLKSAKTWNNYLLELLNSNKNKDNEQGKDKR